MRAEGCQGGQGEKKIFMLFKKVIRILSILEERTTEDSLNIWDFCDPKEECRTFISYHLQKDLSLNL